MSAAIKSEFNQTLIIYITGKPGVGKYTVAKALAESGFVICDNQLINNPIFELLNYDGYQEIPKNAWNTIARIRDCIFDFMANCQDINYVLTNNLYEDDGDRELYQQVLQLAQTRSSMFVPVRLTVSREEHRSRIIQFDRGIRFKSVDPSEVDDLTPLLTIDHPHFIELDTTSLSPLQVSNEILNHIGQLQKRQII